MDLELTHIRQNIDAIDKELVALLEQRMTLVSQVATFKKETGKPILDTAREETVLAKVADLVKKKDYTASIQSIFRDMMAHSRAYQASQLKKKQ